MASANILYVVKEGKVLTNHGMKDFWFTNNENFAYSFDDEKIATRFAVNYDAQIVEGFRNLEKYIAINE